jgi:hypothetical protein
LQYALKLTDINAKLHSNGCTGNGKFFVVSHFHFGFLAQGCRKVSMVYQDARVVVTA